VKSVGWLDNTASTFTSFSGLSVDNTSILIKFTYAGDLDLNGQVDVNDLGILATNWQTAQVWKGRDFDYNDFGNVNDLGLLASNWQAGVGAPLFAEGGGGDPVESFMHGIEKIELSKDEVEKLLALVEEALGQS
jgi:hypothetical protein